MTYPSLTENFRAQETVSEIHRSSISTKIVVMWLFGMFVLLPVKIIPLPSNLELVDLWVVLALPFFWLSFILGGRVRISMSYAVPILLILTATCLSAFSAPVPLRGMIVLVKELYLFVFFVTLTALLSALDARDLRRMMVVWAAVVILHGLLILAQFLLPDIWHMTTGIAGQSTAYANFRPSGLFVSEKAGDANKAAFFQLVGFVPLVLARPPKRIAMFLATSLFLSIIATGSMGTTTALMGGITVSVITLLVVDSRFLVIKKYLTQLLIVASLLLASLTIVLSQSRGYREHFDSIITGRAEKSSGGRFALWQRGIETFVGNNALLWGVGPENFREVDPSGNDNQLHNDLLAFTVERGLIGVAGLILLGIVAIRRAVQILRIYSKYPQGAGLFVVVFFAAIAAMLTVSLTHQIFHAREMWLVLAAQEAMILHARGVP